jgi:hypothetical protein
MKSPRHHRLDDKLHALLLGTMIAIGLAIGCAVVNVAADADALAARQAATAPTLTATAVAATGIR